MLAKYILEVNADYRRIRQRFPLGVLHTKAEYHRAVAALDDILDEIGQQETLPLADLAETLALSIEAYEDTHVAMPDTSGPEILRSLMEEHELTQSDMPEIGSQGVVSEILSGKRDRFSRALHADLHQNRQTSDDQDSEGAKVTVGY
jgi:HTH-type transcriptional regulator/antitoxin HigA